MPGNLEATPTLEAINLRTTRGRFIENLEVGFSTAVIAQIGFPESGSYVKVVLDTGSALTWVHREDFCKGAVETENFFFHVNMVQGHVKVVFAGLL